MLHRVRVFWSLPMRSIYITFLAVGGFVAAACVQQGTSGGTAKGDHSSHTGQMVQVEKDVRLEVLDWGGTGRPIILLAGLGYDAHVFDDFAPKLASSYHVYGVTRRGFGASSIPVPEGNNYSADRLGDDVLEVMKAQKIERPVLAGHSIAGEELSSIGSRYPDKVAGLIYLDAGYPYAYYSADSAGRSPNCCWLDTRLDAEELQTNLKAYLAGATGTDQNQIVSKLLTQIPQLQKDLEADQKRAELLPSPPDSERGPKPPVADAAAAINEGEQ